MAWLRSARIPPRQLRNEGLLRLAFADLLPREDAIALVRRLRARSEDAEREFRTADRVQAPSGFEISPIFRRIA